MEFIFTAPFSAEDFFCILVTCRKRDLGVVRVNSVMVVDDSLFVYDEIKHSLAGTEFEVVRYCRDAEQAIQGYHEIRPDVVLMDIILPGIDGIEATKAMLAKWPDANIVMVSSLAYDETIERAKQIGAKSFVFKPFDKDHLLDVLRQVIEPASKTNK